MSYAAHVSVWNGQHANATLLQVLDCKSVQFQHTQFGGPAQGKFSVYSKYEDDQTGNLTLFNRIDCYLYRDTTTQSVSAGSTTIVVNDGTRFAASDHVVLYDGVNQDFLLVSGVVGNTVTFTPAIAHAYAVVSTVGTLRYRGRITDRMRTAGLDYHTDVTTAGYFTQLGNNYTEFGAGGQECGWLMYHLCSLYASDNDLTTNPANFTMTTAASGTVNGTGTNIAYYAQVAEQQLSQSLSAVALAANGNPGGASYSLWADTNNALHFGALPSSPTITYTVDATAVPGDGVADLISNVNTTDQDGTQIFNVYKLTGGSGGAGLPIQCVVADQLSINTYTQIEKALTVPSITDQTALLAYGQALLNQTAYPITKSQIDLACTGAFATGQDYIAIIGFQNLAPNSDFLPTSKSMPANQQWSLTGAWTITTHGPASANAYTYVGTGSVSGYLYPKSPVINLLAGNTYIFSAAINPAHITAGTATLGIWDPTVATTFESTTISAGASGRFSTPPYTPTTNQAVVLLFDTNNCTVASGLPLDFSQPMLEHAKTASPTYVRNCDLFLNVETADTTWTPGSEVKQKIVAVELIPDTNRIMRDIASQHYLANAGTVTAGVQLTNRYVQLGLQGSITGDVFSLTAGTIYANVLVGGQQQLSSFTTQAFSFTPVTDGLWSVACLYADATGAAVTPSIVTFNGNVPPIGSTYGPAQYVPLYRITQLGGVIIDAQDVRNVGGISTANIQPAAVTQTQLIADPAINTPPALASGTALSGPTYFNAGNGSYEAVCTFTLNVTNPHYLSGIRVFAVPHGASFAGNASPKGDYPASSSGLYEVAVSGLAGGSQYDLYVTRVDTSSNPSAPLLLCTTASNALALSASSLPGMPPNTTPVLSGSASITYPNVGSATFDADVAITTTATGTTSSPWLLQIEALAQPFGQSNSWTIYNEIIGNVSGVYTIPYGGLGAGQIWQLGIRFRDYQGNPSNVTIVGTTVANPIQGPAIANNAIGSQHLGMLNGQGQFPYTYTPAAITQVINSNGQINLAPPGGTTGLLPYVNNGLAFTSTVMPAPDVNGSYLASSSVVTRNIQPTNVLNTQIAANRYTTTLANSLNTSPNQYYWTRTTGTPGPVNSGNTLITGDVIVYDVGTAMDAGSSNPSVDTLTLGADATCSLQFKHNKFTAGGNGIVNVYFTGGSVGSGANVIQSTTANGSDQPTITHTTTNNYTNDPYTVSLGSFSSTPSISQTPNTGYTNTAHSGSATAGTGSSASVTTTTTPASVAGPSGSTAFTKTSYHEYTTPDPPLKPYYISDGDTYSAGDTTAVYMPSNSKGDGTARLVLSASTTSGYTYTVIAYSPGGGVAGSVSGITGAYNMPLDNVADGYFHAADIISVPPADTWNGNGTAYNHSSASTSFSSSISYNAVAYAGNSGSTVNFVDSGTGTVAPVDAAHQVSLTVNALSAPSDTHGTTRIDLYLNNPANNTTVQTWTGVTAGNTYSYYNAGAVSGQYLWYYQTVLVSNAHTGTSTYAGTITGTASWYQSDPYTYYTYANNDGTGTAYYTASSTQTVAPTTSATQISLVLSSLSLPSNANGSSELVIQLVDPNSNVVVNEPVTTTGTYSYYNAGAVGGQYKWVLFGRIATDTSTGTSSYAVTAGGYVEWYENTNHPSTTWYNNAGIAYTYTTPSNALAPTTSAAQLTLNLSSVTTPSNSAGTSYVVVTLKNPAGTTVYTSGNLTTATTITYSATGATAGVYTWTIYAQAATNNSADSTYVCSWAGSHSWYQAGPAGGNTYTLASDGVTQRLATADHDLFFTTLDSQSFGFQVSNNASSAVTFQVGLDCRGV